MAGRHEKVRNVGIEPEYLGFAPDGLASGSDITLTVDELETLRLVDLERLSQARPRKGGGCTHQRSSAYRVRWQRRLRLFLRANHRALAGEKGENHENRAYLR